jgi:hypothetical protein
MMSFGPTFSLEKEDDDETETVLSEQILSILRQAELGMAVSDIVR